MPTITNSIWLLLPCIALICINVELLVIFLVCRELLAILASKKVASRKGPPGTIGMEEAGRAPADEEGEGQATGVRALKPDARPGAHRRMDRESREGRLSATMALASNLTELPPKQLN